MRDLIRILIAGSIGLSIISVVAIAESTDGVTLPEKTIGVPGVQAPAQTVIKQQPAVKLPDSTINAITNPNLPSASQIPQKKIKPADVPKAITQPGVNPGKPAVATSAPKVTTPSAPTTTAVSKPAIDNRQLQLFQQIQNAAIQAATVKSLNDVSEAGQLPERAAESGIDDRLGDNVIGRTDGPSAEELIRQALIGRGGTFEDAQVGRSDGGGANAMNYGVGATPGTELVNDGGVASAGYTKDSHVTDWLDFGSSDDGRSRSGSNWYANGANVQWFQNATTEGTAWSEFHKDSDGNLYMVVKGFDEGSNGEIDPGDTRLETVRDEDGTIRERECQGGECGEWVEIDPQEDSQPNEVASGKYGDCNPVTGWGCKKKGSEDPMEKLTQPSPTGEGDTGTGSGAPSVGAVAVTNPDEFHQTGGSGGSGNSKPYDPRDPPEGLDPSNPEPVPGGPGATTAAAEALDEIMGAAAIE